MRASALLLPRSRPRSRSSAAASGSGSSSTSASDDRDDRRERRRRADGLHYIKNRSRSREIPGRIPDARVDQLIVRDIREGDGAEIHAGDSGKFEFIAHELGDRQDRSKRRGKKKTVSKRRSNTTS